MSDSPHYPDGFWRSLNHLNAFRLFLALFLTALALLPNQLIVVEASPNWLLAALALGYLAMWGLFRFLLNARRVEFGFLLQAQLGVDIAVIVVFMHFAGGNQTGLGLILTVFMAAAGLHPQTRVMLLMPALATLAVLLEQGSWVFIASDAAKGYMRAALLSVGYFTMAGISHILAKDALAAARLASEKTREAADLARINAKVIQDLPNGVLVIGSQGQLWNYNQQAERLLDCSLASLSELMACNTDLAKVWRDWLNVRGPDAAVLPLADSGRRLRCRLIELAPDRKAGAVMILEDMSELEYEANQMKLAALGRLTANLAHEIRNPLSAINQAAQLLGEDAAQDAGMVRLTRIVEDNVSRLNYLVEDVLSLSRRDRMNREAIGLDDFLGNFVSQFEQSEAVAPGVIRLETGEDVVIGFDRMHLNQILWNLFRNALRHCSRQPGSIVLNVERAGEAVYIELWNDGPTIPAEMRQRLFEPFYSTDKSGTGLGLHIALELTEANEGLLRCLEQVQGARFRLTAKIAT